MSKQMCVAWRRAPQLRVEYIVTIMDLPTTSALAFCIHSVVPGLQDVPRPHNQAQSATVTAPAFLRLSEESHNAVNSHLVSVGPDCSRFAYSVKDQCKIQDLHVYALVVLDLYTENTLQLFAELKLYVPTHDDCDVQYKFAIQKSDTKKIGKNKSWKRVTRFYQCQCGIDNTTGRFASKGRQIPWRNVGCMSWVKLMTTHMNDNGSLFYVFISVKLELANCLAYICHTRL